MKRVFDSVYFSAFMGALVYLCGFSISFYLAYCLIKFLGV